MVNDTKFVTEQYLNRCLIRDNEFIKLLLKTIRMIWYNLLEGFFRRL